MDGTAGEALRGTLDGVAAGRFPPPDGGVTVLGQPSPEVAVEVDPACQGRGVGRAAIAAARHLVPGGEPLWAQIAPGNAASVRAFLAAGFRPAGAEVLLVRS